MNTVFKINWMNEYSLRNGVGRMNAVLEIKCDELMQSCFHACR